MTVRELIVKIVLNAANLNVEAEKVQKEADDVRKSITELQQAFADAVKKDRNIEEVTAEYHRLRIELTRTGVSEKELQVLDEAAENLGVHLADAGKSSSAFTGLMSRLGLVSFGLAAVKGAIVSCARDSAEIGRLANMGMSAEAYQSWQYAACETGVDVGKLSAGMADLGNWLQDLALNDAGPLKDVAFTLGISFEDAGGGIVSLEEGMLRLARAAADLDRQEAISLFTQIGFDEQTLPFLLQGEQALKKLIAAGQKNARYTEQDLKNSGQLCRAWQQLSDIFKRVRNGIIRALSPAIEWLLGRIEQLDKWCTENETAATVAFGAVTAVITALPIPALISMAAAITATVVVVEDFIAWLNGGKSALGNCWALFGEAEDIKAGFPAVRVEVRQWFDSILNVLNSIWEVDQSIFTISPEHLLSASESIREAFLKIGEVWKNLLNWTVKKLAGLLPDWTVDLLGIGIDEATAEKRAVAWRGAVSAIAYGRGGMLAQLVNRTISNRCNTTTNIQNMAVYTQARDGEALIQSIESELNNQTAQTDGAMGS